MSLFQLMSLSGCVSQMREPACDHLVITIDEINICLISFFCSSSVQLHNTQHNLLQQSVIASVSTYSMTHRTVPKITIIDEWLII